MRVGEIFREEIFRGVVSDRNQIQLNMVVWNRRFTSRARHEFVWDRFNFP